MLAEVQCSHLDNSHDIPAYTNLLTLKCHPTPNPHPND